ncbi:hypothetical protein A4A49_25129 [Nicotiana attenuata]|uniref:Uncharacterized protein n=1 Tax=Nicotiana attenuata TaxID=49451 RepID=A0A314KPC1_NICAT|nr:hypothetical protein A4A49_25129 [Nicotiana attenuata]
MALLFLNTVFSTLGSVISLIIRLFFSTSYAFVFMIQALKVPGNAIQTGLQAIGDAVKACLEYVLDLLLEVLSAAASSFFDLLKKSLVDGSSAMISAAGEVMETLKNSSVELSKELLEVFEGLQQMISKIVEDLLKNYMDAVKYVIQNA